MPTELNTEEQVSLNLVRKRILGSLTDSLFTKYCENLEKRLLKLFERQFELTNKSKKGIPEKGCFLRMGMALLPYPNIAVPSYALKLDVHPDLEDEVTQYINDKLKVELDSRRIEIYLTVVLRKSNYVGDTAFLLPECIHDYLSVAHNNLNITAIPNNLTVSAEDKQNLDTVYSEAIQLIQERKVINLLLK